MKILIDGRVLASERTGGVQRYACDIVHGLERLGVGFDVAEPTVGSTIAKHVWEHTLLAGLARRYDVLFCPANVAPLYVPRNTALVVTVHCLRHVYFPQGSPAGFTAYYRAVIPAAASRADAIIAVSNTEAANIAKRLPSTADKIRVVHNGIDQSVFSPSGSAAHGRYVLFVGSASPAKNLTRLVRAYAAVCKKIPQKLLIVGVDEQDAVKTRSLRHAVAMIEPGRVEFLGKVDPQTLVRLYRDASLLAMPSLQEGFGYPPLEAMACGTPAVVADIDVFHETCGAAATFVNPWDAQSIAAGLLEVLTNDALRRELVRKGLNQVRRFSLDRCAKRTFEVLAWARRRVETTGRAD